MEAPVLSHLLNLTRNLTSSVAIVLIITILILTRAMRFG